MRSSEPHHAGYGSPGGPGFILFHALRTQATPGTVGNAGILYINVEGAREPFADMYNWAELKWWWRNPYTQHMLLQYFEPTGLVTQLPDAYNYKPYWCALSLLCCCTLSAP